MHQHTQLDSLYERDAPEFTRALSRLVKATAGNDPDALDAARSHVAGVIGRTRALAALMAGEQVVRAMGRQAHATYVMPVVDQPTFEQAVRAILRRVPMLARGWEAVRDAHMAGGIAFAHSASLNVTRRVQQSLADAIVFGQDRPTAVGIMRQLTGWTHSYATTVYRTNLSSAYAEGTRETAGRPEVADAIAGLIYSATMDSDTRPNHAAADGLAGRADDLIWDTLSPPLGWACRCGLGYLSRHEARARGLLDKRTGELPVARRPLGAGPDVGFRR